MSVGGGPRHWETGGERAKRKARHLNLRFPIQGFEIKDTISVSRRVKDKSCLVGN